MLSSNANLLPLPKEWQNAGNLEKPPAFYPMEATNEIFSMRSHSLSMILRNITACLKIMSIHAKFSSDPLAVAMLTLCNIEMYMSFWLSTDANNCIVEIQLRRGCSITFQKYVEYIFQAANGNFNTNEIKMQISKDLFKPMVEKIDCYPKSTINNIETGVLREIALAQEQLEVDRIDTRILALKNLCIMTNPDHINTKTCAFVGRAVLCNVDSFTRLRESIYSILFCRTMGDNTFGKGVYEDYMDSDDECDFFLDEDDMVEGYAPYLAETMAVMFNLALNVITNALKVLSKSDSFDAFVKEDRSTMIITLLSRAVKKAETKPHDTYLCIKALRLLCEHSILNLDQERNLFNDIYNAYYIGCKSHALLQDESWLLLEVIENRVRGKADMRRVRSLDGKEIERSIDLQIPALRRITSGA